MNSTAISEWKVRRITKAGKAEPGFAGPGHTARKVFGSDNFELTNPFVLMMDDTLAFQPGQPVGEAHPHAGLETVTLILEGSLIDAAEGHLHTGDLAWMTAGRGIVHNEDVVATGHARILQLWVALPQHHRDEPPALQIVPLQTASVRNESGAEVRLYSGRAGELESPTVTRVPMTVVDLLLQPHARVWQAFPAGQSGFAYVTDGRLTIGDVPLRAGEVGWGAGDMQAASGATIVAGDQGARVTIYAGQPIDESVMQHGPFVGGSRAELAHFYQEFHAGHFVRIRDVAVAKP
ncbi:pirin-like C-terminal cupin domain-containing protein [Stenotrophomonas sp. SY1]|uniref:pirin family protein n=1 Tax=Stenotrophomonas sp. SY1 TaxID=477235 RepID=UPI001E3F47BA|nr:pirin-like C-terminal cupin domain-containing protein [Stenotrophomonas sp. SY1]MCD9087006.1 pirin family protein [Stenotrophomonas sp. SY1]